MELNEDNFIYQSMITYLGNKRKLIPHIENIVEEVCTILNKKKLNIFDGFSGSNVVSRSLVKYSDNIYVNDLENYAYKIAKVFMNKPSETQQKKIYQHLDIMNNLATEGPYIEGFVSKLYAPKNTEQVQKGERCFYTRENALIIDTLRNYIEEKVEEELKDYCLVPLLIKSSIQTNTSGVFKGFYKDKNGIGCYGGVGKNALSRIFKTIKLEYPIWSNEKYNAHCFKKCINVLIEELPSDIDLIYLDPPYNQHPYSSNYFMLNLIIENREPENISVVSGIPSNWNKSSYNYKLSAIKSMRHLIESGLQKSKYILLSYNNEGIIPVDEWEKIFEKYNVKKYEISYDTFKGCRNLKSRDNKVVEIMYLLSKLE